MKRVALLLAVALMAPLMSISSASAHSAHANAACRRATFKFARFRDLPGNTVNETVSIDGEQVATQTFTFDGPKASNTVTIKVPIGTHTVATHADWDTNGWNGTYDNSNTVSGCGALLCPPTSISASFNDIAIPGDDTIWFNSSFRLFGPSSTTPVTIAWHASTITFSDAGTDYSVPVPDGTITFSPSTTQGTTTYTGTNWSTAVPAGFTDNVFLSGVEFTVPSGGLSGSISPVTWSGQIQTTKKNVFVEWQWSAAVFGGLDSDYNALGVKPLHSATLDQYPNGDEAGTPENFSNFSTGGARGFGDGDGHGSNTDSAFCGISE